MARPRQPVELVVAKGKKHFSKEEIEERRESEVRPCTDDIVAPSYLTAAEKKNFDRIAGQLQKLKIMGETDCETLARYVTAQALYEQAVKDLRFVQKQRPKGEGDPLGQAGFMVRWAEAVDKLDKRVDRYYKQATAAASKLGLTITDRCKLVVPVKEEEPKVNKFSKFSVIEGRQAK